MINGVELSKLNEGEQALVGWQYRRSGGFTTALMDLISRADGDNKDRLALAFPLHVAAYRNFSQVDGWWQQIQKKVLKPVLYEVNQD
jgi:hypothetical protein